MGQARTPKVRRLRLTPEAELDVDDAHAWYHPQRWRLGRDFLQAVNSSIASIRRYPETHPLVDRTMRRALLPRFPYAVFFEVGKTGQGDIRQHLQSVGGTWWSHRFGCCILKPSSAE